MHAGAGRRPRAGAQGLHRRAAARMNICRGRISVRAYDRAYGFPRQIWGRSEMRGWWLGAGDAGYSTELGYFGRC